MASPTASSPDSDGVGEGCEELGAFVVATIDGADVCVADSGQTCNGVCE